MSPNEDDFIALAAFGHLAVCYINGILETDDEPAVKLARIKATVKKYQERSQSEITPRFAKKLAIRGAIISENVSEF